MQGTVLALGILVLIITETLFGKTNMQMRCPGVGMICTNVPVDVLAKLGYRLHLTFTESMITENDATPEPVKLLDVSFLHQVIFQKYLGISQEAQAKKTNLKYFREISQGLKELFEDNGQVLCLQNACSIEQIFNVSKAGGVMPQKSTDFYPKLLTGLTFYPIQND